MQRIPAFVTAVDEFIACVGLIEKKDGEYLNVAKGSTFHKNNIEDELVEQIMMLCGSLYAYGQQTGDTN